MYGLPILQDIIADSPHQFCFKKDRCLRYRLKGFSCDKCLTSCPHDALLLGSGQITIDSETCTNCLRCHAVCPNDAFVPSWTKVEDFQQLLAREQDLVFFCSKQRFFHTQQVDIPCVGMFSIELLLAIGLSRISTIIFDITKCDSCENNAALRSLYNNLKRIESFKPSSIYEKFHLVADKKELPVEGDTDRRLFLSDLASGAISIAKSHFGTTNPRPNTPNKSRRYVPFKTKLLSEVVRDIDKTLQPEISSQLFYQLEVADTCNHCPLCTGICPTGAVKVKKGANGKQITFNQSICSGCGLCVSFCKKDALSLTLPAYISGPKRAIKELC